MQAMRLGDRDGGRSVFASGRSDGVGLQADGFRIVWVGLQADGFRIVWVGLQADGACVPLTGPLADRFLEPAL